MISTLFLGSITSSLTTCVSNSGKRVKKSYQVCSFVAQSCQITNVLSTGGGRRRPQNAIGHSDASLCGVRQSASGSPVGLQWCDSGRHARWPAFADKKCLASDPHLP